MSLGGPKVESEIRAVTAAIKKVNSRTKLIEVYYNSKYTIYFHDNYFYKGVHFSIAAGNEDQDACDVSPAATPDASVQIQYSLSNSIIFTSNYLVLLLLPVTGMMRLHHSVTGANVSILSLR